MNTKSTEKTEAEFIKRICSNQRGVDVGIEMWTDESGQSLKTAARSITAAVRLLRLHGKHYANWRLILQSERPQASPPAATSQ